MAVDYLSALNVGSGLNVTQIVDALIDAEKVPQEARIQEQLDERNVSISSLGDVKSDLGVFKGNLDVYMGATGLVTETTNDAAVGITNNGKIAVQPFTHSISVTQLAASHTLAFVGFTTDSDPINADTVQIDLGTWDSGGTFTPDSAGTSATITIDSTNNTVQSFAAAINAENIGVTANVVRIDETNYALSLISPTGEARQMRVSALSGGAAVSSLSYTDASAHAAKQITAGQDANFTLDGLSITRNTNNVDDIVNGVTIELKQTTTNPVGVGASYDSATALENMTNFVTDLNFLINKLTELTYRGSPSGDDAGPLADDNLVKGYLRSFKRMTTTPIPGFQDQTLYLSNFGVMTELDGSISINEDKFNEFFAANPDAFSAITNTRAVSDSNLVQAELLGSLWKTGTYDFEKSPTTAVAETQTSVGATTALATAEVQTSVGTATALGAAEVQTSVGTSTASAHTIGDVYSLTIGSATISTVPSTVTTDYDTVAKIATALQTAATASATPAVAEVLSSAGTATASSHTIGDVYSLTVGSTTINTAPSTATSDYVTVERIAAALNTAATAASAGFSVAESGGELVITYNNAQDQTDEAVSMSFTGGIAGATFTPPTFNVTTQGADAYSPNFSIAESGGELVISYNAVQTQTDEAVSMGFTAGTPGASFTPPTFSVTTQGADAHTIGDIYSLTVGSTTINTAPSTATTDYDTVAKIATALQTATAATATPAVAEVQSSTGTATASAHTIGDVYSLTVGSTTINTAASTAVTDYDTTAKIAAALQTAAAAASANFSVAESGGELVITYNTAQDQTDEAASMGFTAGTPGASFAPPTFNVTTQGADAYSAGFSIAESGGELVITYDTAQIQTDEAVSMGFTAGTLGASFTPPSFSVTTQGADAHSIGDVYSLTVGSTTISTAASTATTDYDTVAKIAAAMQTAATAASASFSVTESSGEFVITYNTAQEQTDEAVSMSFTGGTPGASYTPPSFNMTTQGADAGTAAKLYKLDENNARIDAGHDMVFEGGKFKITSGDARGLALTMLGDGEDAKIFIGKSLMQTTQEFTENILVPNNDIDVKIKTYNDDIVDFKDKMEDLTERMDNQRALYTEQFTAMESSVASFKKTGDLLTNFMDSWRASLQG